MKNLNISLNVYYYIGILVRFVSLILLLPLFSLLFYPFEYKQILYFIIPSIATFLCAQYFIHIGKPHSQNRLVRGQDAIIVVLTWALTMIFSSLPFILSGLLNIIPALFESVSGWTTTGLSVVDVNAIPKIFLLYRSIIQFFGGVGLVLVVFSVLSETFGMRLFYAEGHNDRLLPNLTKSAGVVIRIYLFYLVVGTILIVMSGLSLFDAINLSMTALSTGGFAITSNSIGDYNNLMLELILIVLMILGNTNFAGHLLLLQKKYKQFIQMDEVKYVFISILLLTIALITIQSFSETISWRIALFEATSAITTTGFTITSYAYWRSSSIFLLVIFMIIGGGSGSTAGGIKQIRIISVIKSLHLGLKKRFLPQQIIKDINIARADGIQSIENPTLIDIYQVVWFYIIALIIGTFLINLHGYPLLDSLFEFTSALGTVGTSVGLVTINSSSSVHIIMIIGMFLGRLEIVVVLVALIAVFKNSVNLFFNKIN